MPSPVCRPGRNPVWLRSARGRSVPSRESSLQAACLPVFPPVILFQRPHRPPDVCFAQLEAAAEAGTAEEKTPACRLASGGCW